MITGKLTPLYTMPTMPLHIVRLGSFGPPHCLSSGSTILYLQFAHCIIRDLVAFGLLRNGGDSIMPDYISLCIVGVWAPSNLTHTKEQLSKCAKCISSAQNLQIKLFDLDVQLNAARCISVCVPFGGQHGWFETFIFSGYIFEMSKLFTHVKLSLSDKASSMSIHIPVHSPSTLQ